MSTERIDSFDDERLAAFRNVPDPDLVARRGLFIAEGRLVVRRLLTASRLETRSLLVTEPALAALADVLDARDNLPTYVVPQAVMNRVTGFNFHRGCLAIGARPPARDWRDVTGAARRLVVLERIGNADNIGSIFRNAAAFAVDGVLLESECGDPLYRKSIRTSMAATLTLPFAVAGAWPDALLTLREEGWRTIALTPSLDAAPLKDVVAAVADQRVALVLGHEGDGLTPAALESCSHRARIPMKVDVDSVNVATAAAIALYELSR